MKEIISRWSASTPSFFKRLGTIGIGIAALGTAILTCGITLPATITTFAGYAVAVGSVTKIISQLTVDTPASEQSKDVIKG
jgi:hypothetical protein